MKTSIEILHDFLVKRKLIIVSEQKELIYKFNENVHFQFAWKGEDLYKNTARINLLDEIIGILENKELKNFTIEKLIEHLTQRVLRTTLMDRSSGQLHSLVSLWDKEVIVEIIELIR